MEGFQGEGDLNPQDQGCTGMHLHTPGYALSRQDTRQAVTAETSPYTGVHRH